MGSSNQVKDIDQFSELKAKLKAKEEELKHFRQMYSRLVTKNTIPIIRI
jgi:hypothetical protein